MIREKISAYRESKLDRKAMANADFIYARHNPDVLEQNRPLDALKTDDKEILGQNKDRLFKDRYRKVADIIEQRIEKAEERVISKDDTLDQQKQKKYRREKYLEYRNNRTDIKITRLKNKLENSNGSFLARQIDRQRRQKLQQLEFVQKLHTSQLGRLEQKRQNKPEELRKKIDKMVEKKVNAMYRKELRKRRLIEQGEKGIGNYNVAKRTAHKAEFIAKMKPEDKMKIVREAILLARRQSIEKGRLDMNYEVDNTLDDDKTRQVTEHYGRIA